MGAEKEGIPVDILQLLDDCVEIPQFGVIRSGFDVRKVPPLKEFWRFGTEIVFP